MINSQLLYQLSYIGIRLLENAADGSGWDFQVKDLAIVRAQNEPDGPDRHRMIRPDPLSLDDPDGARIPPEAAGVVDAHVHLFPDRVFDSIWRWFDANAWPVRHRLYSDGVLDWLESRGVARVVALHYAHKPGMAAALNEYVLAIARRRAPFVIPTATVLPGEPGEREILRRAFGEGARGVKIHCHVQRVAPDDDRLDAVFEEAARARVPVVMHAGREPSTDAYGVDTRALCSAERVEAMLRRHPETTLVVPHLGSDEFDEFDRMLDRHPQLWLDTTMSVAGYFPGDPSPSFVARRADRVLYGTDFPNIPYAWDRELQRLCRAVRDPRALHTLLSGNALRVFAPC